MTGCPRFPVFISLENKQVLIIGGGEIASRRVRVLLDFKADITVVSPTVCADLQALEGLYEWRRDTYAGFDRAYTLVIAATDNRETNKQIGNDAAKAGVPVSVADCKEESTFWFPAIAKHAGLVAGIISSDGDHRAVKQAAKIIRKSLEELS